jgi:hypothetical protein
MKLRNILIYKYLLLVIFSFILILPAKSQLIISQSYLKDAFPLIRNNTSTTIYIDSTDAEVVNIAATAFQNDLNLLTNIKPGLSKSTKNIIKYPVIIGTIGKSVLIDKLAKKNKIPAAQIAGKWESFIITVIDKPLKGVEKALVIAGSDRRGTAFGIFELSKILGISPWVWWADVLPKHQDAIYIKPGTIQFGPPSIKYRGIFLNDEDWGLKPWAAKNLDTDIQDIGPKTYTKIFELMLRLKANYLWPAMHDCTKAFYYYPDNPKVADNYAIVIGSSHCEPILRNNVFEWKVNFKNEYGFEPGEWRYDLNKNQINKYWDDRAKQSSRFESIYTIGMRGIHDGSMPGPKDINGKLKLLDTVIRDQRLILSKETGKPANQIPQIFCPYKEVLTLYQRGLKLPDDITIVWADDNHGYIRQLSTPEEQKRSGHSGVYYHLSYWGSPHDYLWLSSISPSLISFELTKAYQYGADRLWIINVGDIKPAELEIEFAMDLAWNINQWTPLNAYTYPRDWAARTFGEEFADSIASVKKEYYRLSQNGKPEHLGVLSFNTSEMKSRIESFQSIADKAGRIYQNMPERLKDAFFQLVYYPINGALLMNQKIFYARISLDLAKEKDKSALDYARKAKDAYEQIQIITKKYNEQIARGKWNGIMSWKPRNLDVFKMPKVATEKMLTDSVLPELTNNDAATSKPDADIIKSMVAENPTEKTIKISATSFFQKKEKTGQTIHHFNGLGLDGNGIGILPFTANPVTTDSISYASFLEYKVFVNPGTHTITLKCLPTHLIHKDRDVCYGISVNNDSIKIISINYPAESTTWKQNVLHGYSIGQTQHNINIDGESTIRIYLPEPGVIIDRLEVE